MKKYKILPADKIKRLSVLLCLSFPLLISSCNGENKTYIKQNVNDITENNKTHSIYLVNRSNTELKFYYEDKYLDRHQFHLRPDSTYQFLSDGMQIVTQTNEN
jgi:hypothetical protein